MPLMTGLLDAVGPGDPDHQVLWSFVRPDVFGFERAICLPSLAQCRHSRIASPSRGRNLSDVGVTLLSTPTPPRGGELNRPLAEVRLIHDDDLS